MSDTTPPAEILEHACAVLRGDHAIPAHHASRAAAVLARQALEQRVVELCRAHDAEIPNAKMRSRLIILRKVADDAVADLASVSWHGLSTSCHHHANELSPTIGEIQHLLDSVTRLLPAARSPGGREHAGDKPGRE